MALSALVLAAALLSGCGGGGSTGTVADEGVGVETVAAGAANASDVRAAGESEAAGPAGTAVVKVAGGTGRPARVVVDVDGMTVYEFRRDDPMLYQFGKDPVPTCYGACAVTWNPLLTDGPPRAAAGAEASMLGTIRRKEGGTQVTYDDHPLYVFAGDKRPGEMNGQDVDSFGARWHAVRPDGSEFTP